MTTSRTVHRPASASAPATRSGLLQRRCTCGTRSTLFGGACPECSKKRQPAVQAKLRIGRTDDPLEREADQTAERVLRGERPAPAISRAPATVQRDGPAPDTPPKAPTEGEPKPAPAEGGEAAGTSGTAPAPTCDPKGLKRVDYLKQPGTSTGDFGLTTLTASAATVPAVATKAVRGGVQIQPTTAALPPIPSVFTTADTFVEGVAHFVNSDGRHPCPSGKLPIRWTITAKGADKIREGEQDHCLDFQLAFDLSLKRYASAVNALAGKRRFANQAAAENALKKAVGVHPDDWFDKFVCLTRKTLVRDRQKWHEPKPVTREPRSDDCGFVRAFITETSLPEVGQAKHPSADIIKDCGEAGIKAPAKAPAREGKGKVGAPDLAGADWLPWEEGEDEQSLMQRREDPAAGSAAAEAPAPDLVHQVLDTPGRPLDEATRAFMEPRFGRDFGDVRIHVGDQAARSALSVDALAYTVDRHVVFGHGAYEPASESGRQLLAHELAHVVQQTGNGPGGGLGSGRSVLARRPRFRTDFRRDSGLVSGEDLLDPDFTEWLGSLGRADLRGYQAIVADPAVQRYIDLLLMPDPVAGVERGVMNITPEHVANIEKLSYWEQRVWRTLDVTPYTDRLGKSAEERDAVYAALAQATPSLPLTGASSTQVVIPANAERAAALLYRFDFTPRAPGAAKDKVDIHFVLERPGRIATPAKDLPLAFKEPTLSFDTELGFEHGVDPFWKQHPDEKRQVAFAVSQASGRFDLILQTRSPPKGTARPHEATLRIRGVKDAKGATSQLEIELLAEGRLPEARLPTDYRQRDYGDLLINDAQSTPSKKGDTLGHVDLSPVPQDEQAAVKLSIVNYFNVTGSRNVEVDAIVPIPSAKRRVFYKFYFRNDNEVDMQRIGVEGQSPKLDPDALDVARVEGFDAHSATAPELKTWLGKRYLALKPEGSTVPEVQQSANKVMQAEAGTPGWFEKQYKIFPLTAGPLASRLKTTHKQAAASTAGTKDFQPNELKHVERGLQTLSDPLVTLMHQVRLGRQAKALKADGTPDEETLPDGTKQGYGGKTYTNGSARSIVYYDGLLRTGQQFDFRGDAQRVNRADTHIVLHEFGHVIAGKTGAQAAFNSFVKKEGIAPFTAYAQRHPAKEFFEDAFDMFQNNPSWMLQTHPRLHRWFQLLSTTGQVPTKLP
ncbi:eCIS core domain-containing protein [Ideonella sp.]|uniref:eCIS core domain-containing protein n=1 Tax=Ideonella sp. TaxID=1929293 RepID=UPI002B48E287|nr:DUF4157 domain-containing protein [Ideonella sp.]HJV68749.1 DUF4157 domain-containing protein [Ideonella sp.]